MALPSSGELKMGGAGTNSIAQEKAGTTSGTPSAVENVSLRGLSVDGINDFTYTGGAAVDITGTPNGTAPYAMSEFHGYSQFAWGTPGPIFVNATYPFSGYQEDRDGSDTCYVTSCNMVLNTSTKSISFTFTNTDDQGGFSVNLGSTNTATLSYTGTISSLEARFVHSGETITVDSSSFPDDGRVIEMFSNSSHLSSANVANNAATGTSAQNDISSGASGTYQSLRTTSGNMSIALAVMSDDCSQQEASIGKIEWGSGDTVKIQLRANGSKVVDLYTRTGGFFFMEAQTTEEGTS
jgi:hypothetical protein